MQLQPKGLSLCAVSILKMTFHGSTLWWQWWWFAGDFLDFVLASYDCLGFLPQYKTYILGQLVILTLASVNGCLIVL